MSTCFASAKRAGARELKGEIDVVVKNPVVQGLLHSVSGLLAVLDEYRQVVALNDSFLQMLGIDNPGEMLGLRMGEVLLCVHSLDGPSGCGTTKYCATCGAAIAIVTTLAQDTPVERICALTANRDDAAVDISLLVRASPIRVGEKRFVLLFLQDITLEQLRAALERTFFHDINNMLTGLLGASGLLAAGNKDDKDGKLVGIIHQSALRLADEVAIQTCLFQGDIGNYQVVRHEISSAHILAELQNVFTNHSLLRNKKVLLPEIPPSLTINTDISLVLRVLCNMVTNALEATDPDGAVKVWHEHDKDQLIFHVWNDKSISEEVQYRIFQQNFSTKEGAGRGIGTYSMKLLGEKLLGGKVSFTSSAEDGTVFRFALPR